MQEHLYRYFSSPGHRGFLNDVSVTLIDKTDGSDLKKREDYWMNTLKTMAPYRLNIEDSVYVDLNYCSLIFGFMTRFFLFWTVNFEKRF